MTKILVVLVVCTIAIGLVGNAFAHKAEVIGDYKIEVGWENEPPVIGQKNTIEIIVTVATEHDKKSPSSDGEHVAHDENMTDKDHSEPGAGVSGLSDKLEATLSLNGQKTVLNLAETSKHGVYHAKYTPAEVGFPSVNLVGKIGQGDEFEITFHPEKIEDLSVLSPLKQIHANIAPSDVKCKEGLQLLQSASGRTACVGPSGAAKLVAWGWGTIV